jgi:hypothetical protein
MQAFKKLLNKHKKAERYKGKFFECGQFDIEKLIVNLN